MFYLVEGYRQRSGRKLAEEPVRTSVVTIQQLTGAIIGILKEDPKRGRRSANQ